MTTELYNEHLKKLCQYLKGPGKADFRKQLNHFRIEGEKNYSFHIFVINVISYYEIKNNFRFMERDFVELKISFRKYIKNIK